RGAHARIGERIVAQPPSEPQALLVSSGRLELLEQAQRELEAARVLLAQAPERADALVRRPRPRDHLLDLRVGDLVAEGRAHGARAGVARDLQHRDNRAGVIEDREEQRAAIAPRRQLARARRLAQHLAPALAGAEALAPELAALGERERGRIRAAARPVPAR